MANMYLSNLFFPNYCVVFNCLSWREWHLPFEKYCFLNSYFSFSSIVTRLWRLFHKSINFEKQRRLFSLLKLFRFPKQNERFRAFTNTVCKRALILTSTQFKSRPAYLLNKTIAEVFFCFEWHLPALRGRGTPPTNTVFRGSKGIDASKTKSASDKRHGRICTWWRKIRGEGRGEKRKSANGYDKLWKSKYKWQIPATLIEKICCGFGPTNLK